MSAPANANAARERKRARDATRPDELTELGSAFRRVFRSLSRLRGRDTHLAGSELSHAQFELLIELDERGGAVGGRAGGRRAADAGDGHPDARSPGRQRPRRKGPLGERPAGGGVAADAGRAGARSRPSARPGKVAGKRRSGEWRGRICARPRACSSGLARCSRTPLRRTVQSPQNRACKGRFNPRLRHFEAAGASAIVGLASRCAGSCANTPAELPNQDGDLEQITKRPVHT